MIKNEREYKATKSAISSYEIALSNFDILKSIENGVNPVIANAQRTSFERQIEDLSAQVEAYERIRNGSQTQFTASSISEIGEQLVAARIARGLTQREFAIAAGLKEQQIQRYEKELYSSASLKRLTYLTSALGVTFNAEISVESQSDSSSSDFFREMNPAHYPLSEMKANGWLDPSLDLRSSSVEEKRRALISFFSRAGVTAPTAALHRKTRSKRSVVRESATLAWQARILARARSRTGLARRYTPLAPADLKRFVSLSTEQDGHIKAVDMLLGFGIIVVFERHLKGTKLDGAAMSMDGKYAVVGMSIRFDRLDNFWFVLLHELGHVSRHWGPLLRDGFLDDEDDETDALENEANEFASNAIVSQEAWHESFVRFTMSRDAVCQYANKIGVHPALVAGRIRKERNDYTVFSDLIGSGLVRGSLKQAKLMD